MYWPAILSGILLWASFFPLDLGPVAFVGLVPWLMLVRAPGSNRRRYLAAYIGGFTFFFPALQWIRVAHPMMYLSWLGLSLVLPLFWVAALGLLRRIDRLKAIPFALSVPVVWVALEYVRAHFPTGFPFLQHVGLYQMVGFGWYFLGYTQHEFEAMLQAADLGGVYAVSFVVAAVNGAIFDWLTWSPAFGRRYGWEALHRPSLATIVPTTGAVAVLFAGSIVYGLMKLEHAPFAEGPRVSVIQGNVSQDDKTSRSDKLVKSYRNLYGEALDQRPRPDLIIWPETCCAIDWYEPPPTGTSGHDSAKFNNYLEGYRNTVEAFLSRRPPTNVLFGLNGLEWEDGKIWKYNSAVLIGPSGKKLGRYDKMHLVPFGEYVPFKETLPFMSMFTPYKTDYSCRPGEHWTRFPLKAGGKDYHFGCLICYEDSDPYLARQYVADGDKVNFLVNISNDGWFNGTEEHEQHLAICRFRAVETRRSIIRSVNMGISCVIDPDGRVIALPGKDWSSSKKIEAVLTAVAPIDDRPSIYAQAGDWVPAGCWLLLVVGVGLSLVRRGSWSSNSEAKE